ncbi:MAG: hypothetical protein R2877_05700 [Bdellovibrionota bacterium]
MGVALMLGMKTTFQHTLLAVLLITLFASIGFAQENETYRPNGFHKNITIGALVAIGAGCDDNTEECWFDIPPVLPGKFNLTLGYQLNPYVSLDFRLWDFWLVLLGAEAGATVHLTDTRVSPYVLGGVGSIITFGPAPYLFAGGGFDLNISKRTAFFAEAKYYMNAKEINNGGVIPEFGLRFKF